MADGGDNDASNAGAGQASRTGGPNVRGGVSSGTTRLTSSNGGGNNSGLNNQSCNC
jgi:hypothetical protein